MARKKKIETKDYLLDTSTKFSLSKDIYIDQIKKYLEQNIKPKCKISKDGNKLNISVPITVSKKMLKMRMNKYLYTAGLKTEYRIITLNSDKGEGYKIIEK